jgi:hypothetical protein
MTILKIVAVGVPATVAVLAVLLAFGSLRWRAGTRDPGRRPDLGHAALQLRPGRLDRDRARRGARPHPGRPGRAHALAGAFLEL